MKIPYFDAHCDTLSRMAYLPGAHLGRRTGQWDLEKLSRFDGPKAQIFAVFYDSALPGASRAAERQIAVLTHLRRNRRLQTENWPHFSRWRGRSCWTVQWESWTGPMLGACVLST